MTPRSIKSVLAMGIAFLPALLAVLLLGGATPARAAGTVGSGSPASCTDAALNTAMAGGGLVTFNCGASPVTITVTAKTITLPTTINGGGLVSLSGNNVSSFFTVTSMLTLQNLTLTNGQGSAAYLGGAIRNMGTLVLRNIQFINNLCHGGDLYNHGVMTTTNTTFFGSCGVTNDVGTATMSGLVMSNSGGVYNQYGNVTLNNIDLTYGGVHSFHGAVTISGGSIISANTGTSNGAGLDGYQAVMNVSHVTLRGNYADVSGAGFYNYSGPATLTDVVFINNTSGSLGGGGGIMNEYAPLTITHASFIGNQGYYGGGGLYNNRGTVVMNDVTFSGNQASTSDATGGAIYNSCGTVRLTNATLSGNTAFYGGGIANCGPMWLTDVTLDGNSATDSFNPGQGGGIYTGDSVTLTASIVANSVLGGDCYAAGPAGIISGDHNLASDTSCNTYLTQPHDQKHVDPKLGPLANNGGLTWTHLPAANSPAVDHGGLVCIAFDQRGVTRPQGPACDIGAVERQASDGGTTLYLYLPLVRH